MMNVHRRREQSKQFLKGFKGQINETLNAWKCMLAEEKNINNGRQARNLILTKKFDFDQAIVEKLKQSINDPTLFWHTLRSVNRKAAIYNDIIKEQWYEHFFNVLRITCALPQLDEASHADTAAEETHAALWVTKRFLNKKL